MFDIGYADKIDPVLAAAEKPVPNDSRGGSGIVMKVLGISGSVENSV
ncbi:MAG: hypothetical protein ACI8Z1_000075 [Candidatus Azotimanducaceae bacterium]|jgi:hypothetical protein